MNYKIKRALVEMEKLQLGSITIYMEDKNNIYNSEPLILEQKTQYYKMFAGWMFLQHSEIMVQW